MEMTILDKFTEGVDKLFDKVGDILPRDSEETESTAITETSPLAPVIEDDDSDIVDLLTPEEVAMALEVGRIERPMDLAARRNKPVAIEPEAEEPPILQEPPTPESAPVELPPQEGTSEPVQEPVARTPQVDMVKQLSDFIGNLEAPEGYNQIQGRNKSAPLDTMSINEVFQMQNRMLRIGHESSAVGRYQIINSTLKDLTRQMNLKGNELFTPELQDEMFVQLLKKRGLNSYLKGSIDVHEFGNNLAKEWAALPVVKDIGKRKVGSSYYSGVGSNQSLVDVESYLNLLQQTGEAGQEMFLAGEGERLSPITENGEAMLTPEGRPVYQNQYGDQVTERSITIPLDGLWYNIPTVYDGSFVDDDEATQRIMETQTQGKFFDPITGRELQPFATVEDAVKEAQERSKSLEVPRIIRDEDLDLPEEERFLMQRSAGGSGEVVDTITPEVRTAPGDAWEKIFNVADSLGFERATSQRLADVGSFITELSPSSSADVLRAGTEKIAAGRTTEGISDIAFEAVPVVGDVGLSIFAGVRKSGGYDTNFVRAAKSIIKGTDKETVRKDTGWFRGRDGGWRFEIDDSPAKIIVPKRRSTMSFLQGDPSLPDLMFLDLPLPSNERGLSLDKVLDHPELFLQYPQLRNIEVVDTPVFASGIMGAYNSETNRLFINAKLSDDKAISTILHEVQHAIQDIEGFVSGGSMDDFLPKGFNNVAPKIKKRVEDLFASVALTRTAILDTFNAVKEGKRLSIFQKGVLENLKSSGKSEEIFDALEAFYAMRDVERQAFSKYQAIAGEVEARNVEARILFSEEDRINIPPFETESVPPQDQLRSPHDRNK